MKYLKVFCDFATTIEALSDAEKGRLFTAMLEYAESGTAPELRGNERIIWSGAKQMIDREMQTYQKVCERNLRNATTRYQSVPKSTTGSDTLQDKDKDKDKEKLPNGSKEKAHTFVRPTVSVIRAYADEAGLKIDCNAFVDFYESKGWKVGTAPMRDWKAALRNWARRDAERKQPAKKHEVYRDNREKDDMDELMKELGI